MFLCGGIVYSMSMLLSLLYHVVCSVHNLLQGNTVCEPWAYLEGGRGQCESGPWCLSVEIGSDGKFQDTDFSWDSIFTVSVSVLVLKVTVSCCLETKTVQDAWQVRRRITELTDWLTVWHMAIYFVTHLPSFILVLWQKSRPNSSGGNKQRWGSFKLAIFDQILLYLKNRAR